MSRLPRSVLIVLLLAGSGATMFASGEVRGAALNPFGAVSDFAALVRPDARVASPALLPPALAHPAEVTFADTLRHGETLTQLLRRARFADADVSGLLPVLRLHQDPRLLRPGSVITYTRSVPSGHPRALELPVDNDHALRMVRSGSEWEGIVEEVPVQPDTVVLEGVVQSSLYAALLEQEDAEIPARERERVVDILADRIFAWQIDFSRDLRQGDDFRILYERMVRPDGSARSGRVLAVHFNIDSRSYEAYRFEMEDGGTDYFDSEGESLRRAFLRAPLEFRRISSAFSTNRFHPILKRNRPHYGIDYSARSGTPIRAVGDGTVVRAGRAGGYGNVVEIRHKRGYSTRYAHLRAFAKGVRRGARVVQGEIIGYVGATGLATAPHLHFEFRKEGKPINPSSIRSIAADPVPQTYFAAFQQRVGEHLAGLGDPGSGGRLAYTPRNRVAAADQ